MAQDPQHIVDTLHKSQEILFTANTVFPFTLFPDTINIDREKVSIAARTFFRMAEISSFQLDDVLSVTVDVGPFFGSVKIQTKFFDTPDAKPHIIKFLTRTDAMAIKRIMHGHAVARKNKIDLAQFGKDVLVHMLYDLGKDVSD